VYFCHQIPTLISQIRDLSLLQLHPKILAFSILIQLRDLEPRKSTKLVDLELSFIKITRDVLDSYFETQANNILSDSIPIAFT